MTRASLATSSEESVSRSKRPTSCPKACHGASTCLHPTYSFSLPAGVKPISCKWVYKVKRRSDGSMDQSNGRDWLLVLSHSSTGLTTTRRLWQRSLLCCASAHLSNNKQVSLGQMDVKNAFLYGLSLHRSPAFSLDCPCTT